MPKKLILEVVRERCKKYNLEFLDDFYENNWYKHNVKCYCGTIFQCSINNIFSGSIRSCGCFRKLSLSKRRRYNLIGRVFGRLTVVSFAYIKKGEAYWNCLCSCGSLKIALGSKLICGDIKSCGCINRERLHLYYYSH